MVSSLKFVETGSIFAKGDKRRQFAEVIFALFVQQRLSSQKAISHEAIFQSFDLLSINFQNIWFLSNKNALAASSSLPF